ncbi:hypothetical protein ACFXK0_17905 [Nocardia sp. NPDC059177]|uniref:hypothetical protein n=1 Tax=Nocardia sp. NPDC059177 TaxID=3346759 RepID=UPI00367B6F2D
MSTATGALRSHDRAGTGEPVLRRRRTTRAPRPFTLLRGAARPRLDSPRVPVAALPDAVEQAGAASVSPEPRGVLVRTAAPADRRIELPPAELVRTERRSRIFDLTDAEVDLAFATVPRSEPPARPVARPIRVDRVTGPRSELALYTRGRVPARPARGAHPLRRVERAQRGFAALAVTALATALIVVAFLGLAHLRAGSFGDRVEVPVPSISEPADLPSRGLTPGLP